MKLLLHIHGAVKPYFWCIYICFVRWVTNTSWSPWAHPRWASAALSCVCRQRGRTCRSRRWWEETEPHKEWRGSNPAASLWTCSSAPRGWPGWSSSPSPPPCWWKSRSGQIWWAPGQTNRLWKQDRETAKSHHQYSISFWSCFWMCVDHPPLMELLA